VGLVDICAVQVQAGQGEGEDQFEISVAPRAHDGLGGGKVRAVVAHGDEGVSGEEEDVGTGEPEVLLLDLSIAKPRSVKWPPTVAVVGLSVPGGEAVEQQALPLLANRVTPPCARRLGM